MLTEDRKTVSVERVGQTQWITFRRSEQMNAMSMQMLDEMAGALVQAMTDDEVRAVALTGSGRAFCAGADLKEVSEAELKPGEPDLLDRVDHAFGLIRSGPKPVIAAVNGLTLAGGLEMVMACDLVFAAESAKLGDAHSNFGVFPGAGGAAILPRRIGLNRAKYLLFSGEHVSAREMMDWGLVNKVVPDDELIDAAKILAKRIAVNPAHAVRMTRRLLWEAKRSDLATILEMSAAMQAVSHTTADHDEAVDAFIEKRKPVFKGD